MDWRNETNGQRRGGAHIQTVPHRCQGSHGAREVRQKPERCGEQGTRMLPAIQAQRFFQSSEGSVRAIGASALRIDDARDEAALSHMVRFGRGPKWSRFNSSINSSSFISQYFIRSLARSSPLSPSVVSQRTTRRGGAFSTWIVHLRPSAMSAAYVSTSNAPAGVSILRNSFDRDSFAVVHSTGR